MRRAKEGRSASGYRRKHLYRHRHARRRRSGLWLLSRLYTSATSVCDRSGVTMLPRQLIASAAAAYGRVNHVRHIIGCHFTQQKSLDSTGGG